jgi:hypothetical protein
MKAPLPEPPADLSKTLVLLGRPVRTRLELHPEQASWTKSGNFMDTSHGRGKRFGLGSRQGKVMAEEREFHAQSPGYLFFTCSLQAMAPAVVLTWTGSALVQVAVSLTRTNMRPAPQLGHLTADSCARRLRIISSARGEPWPPLSGTI